MMKLKTRKKESEEVQIIEDRKLKHIVYRDYRDDDDERIQEFMQQSYALNGPDYSWMIDRWNFTRSVSRCIHGLTIDEWNNRVMVVEENEHIIAVVNSEGENHGEAFFQLIRDDYENETIQEMFDFAEERLCQESEDGSYLELRLKAESENFVEEALRRGYELQDWKESTAEIHVTDDMNFDYKLPEGYKFVSGNKLSGKAKAVVHRMAFGYDDPSKVLEKRAAIGFKTMEIQPYYNAFLDLMILNEQDEPVCFANFWFDPVNKVGILEPLGTHQAFRKMGLAKAAVYEGIKRCVALGATTINVGSDQDFYKAIGFEVVSRMDIYRKTFS